MRRVREICLGDDTLRIQLGQQTVAILVLVDGPLRLTRALEHAFDARAVLALQPFDKRQAGIDPLEFGRIELGTLEGARDLRGNVASLALQRRRLIRHRTQLAADLRNAGERRTRGAEQFDRSRIFARHRVVRGTQRGAHALDVSEIAPALVQAILFRSACIESRFVDLLRGQ